MQIDLDLLYSWGAVAKKYKKNEIVFEVEDEAHFYYQIIEGSIKMFNSNDDGKEFTQALFIKGNSFGEPPLFIDKKYPASAITLQECIIIKLSKDKFMKILDEYPSIQKSFLYLMAKRIYSKTVTSKAIINQNPEHRIIAFLTDYKNKLNCSNQKILIPFTRQEIANYTGLRVETVIRSFSKMNETKKVEIINHKIYY